MINIDDDTLNVLDLFSGAGLYSLGFEWTGRFRTVGFVENDPDCQELLLQRFPGIPIFGDIREFDPAQVPRRIDVICGGFPCPDISLAGSGAGIEGERSALWLEFARCVCLARPRYAVVENVPALKDRGMGVVLGSLAFGGYDTEWDCLSALSVGCIYQDPQADPDGTIRFQHRNRLWILATLPDTDREQLWFESVTEQGSERSPFITDYRSNEGTVDQIGHRRDGKILPIRSGGSIQKNAPPARCNPSLDKPQHEPGHEGPEVPGMLSGFAGEQDLPNNPERPDQAQNERKCICLADPQYGGFQVPERPRIRKQDPVWCREIGILERARRDGSLAKYRQRTYECWASEPRLRCIPARTPTWVAEIRICGNTNPPQVPQYLGELIVEDARKRCNTRSEISR